MALAVLWLVTAVPALAHSEPSPEDTATRDGGAAAPPADRGSGATRAEAGEADATSELRPPVLEHFVEAEYPEAARRAGIEGTVGLSIVIDEEGKVADARIVRPAGHGFDEAALRAVRRFRFRPAMLGGRPVAVEIRYEYGFVLQAPPTSDPSEGGDAQETARLRGRVLERGTRRPIEGAVVRVAGHAVETDAGGRFEIGGIPAGRHSVRVLAPGHAPLVEAEDFQGDVEVEVTYYLPFEGFDPYETVVHGVRPRKEVTRRTLKLEEIRRIPGTRGDALRVVQTLPGVARTPYGLGPLVLRGSGPYDSRAFLDGHWIPLPFHFGGLTSIFNGDLLRRIDLYPGNFPARFGRSTAGILDVRTRPGRTDGHHGYVDADLYDVGFLVEGPVGGSGSSYAVAARRSYVDAFLGLALKVAGVEDVFVTPFYYDYQARLSHRLGPGDRIDLTLYGSHDDLRILTRDPELLSPEARDSLESRFDFHRLTVEWRHGRGADLRGESSLTLGLDGTGNSFGTDLFFVGDLFLLSGRSDWTFRLGEVGEIGTGIDLLAQRYRLRAMGPPVPAPGQVLDPIARDDLTFVDTHGLLFQPALYLEAALDPGAGVKVLPGLRVDGDLASSAPSLSLDPRLALRWQVTDTLTLKGGVGRYSQPPLSLQTIPEFGNPDLGWEHAVHYALGLETRLLPWLDLDVEAFLQRRFDLAVRSARYVERGGEVVRENYANTGDGRAYGLELQLKVVEVPGLVAWLSYTLSRSEQRSTPDASYRTSSLDQTHNLVAVASYELGSDWAVGGAVRYVTGIPTTPITGAFYDADLDDYLPIPGRIASGPRVPPFFSLDVRIDRRFTFDTWMLSLYLDVTNATNYPNVEAYTYDFDYSNRQPLMGLPIFPSLGVKGEF